MSVFTADWYTSIRQKANAYSQSVTSSLEVSKTKNPIRVLDGLRAIACLAVLSYHFNLLARNVNIWYPLHGIDALIAIIVYFGESGVTLFFLLSGFLLFLPFAKALLFENTSWPEIPRFYIRRVFRIIPGYYVALFLIILFFHPEFLHHNNWHEVWLFLTFQVNPTPAQDINGPFWTLTIEFQFYLLLPIIAWVCGLIVRRGSLRSRMTKLTLCLLTILTWGLVTKYWGMYIADTSTLDFLIPHSISNLLKPLIYGEFGKYFEVFAVGMLLCMVYIYTHNAPSGDDWKQKLRRLSPFLFIAGLALLLFLSFWHFYYININSSNLQNPNHVFTFLDPYKLQVINTWVQWQAFGYAISYGLCMCALLYGSPRLKSPFEWSPLRWIGMISYSLYMWHLPFLFLFINFIVYNLRSHGFPHSLEYFAFCCWTIFLVFPLSLTFYRWIEMPGIRLGEFLIKMMANRKKGKGQVANTEKTVLTEAQTQESVVAGA